MAIGISAGILLALRDAGVPVEHPTTAIGTSAGATVAADIQLGTPLENIADRICTDRMEDDAGSFDVERAWKSWPELARRGVGASWVLARSLSPVRVPLPEPPGFVQRHFPGALLSWGESDDWAAEFYPDEWPARGVWPVAFDVDAHRRVVLSSDGVDDLRSSLPRALQASCAIPALYAPVRVDGARLVDGGIKSANNFDVAARLPQKAVIGVSAVTYDPADPPAGPGRFLRTFPNRTVLREIAHLRRRGHEVLVLHPCRTALELAGTTVLSGRITSDVVEAAYEGASRRLGDPDMQRRLDRILTTAAPV